MQKYRKINEGRTKEVKRKERKEKLVFSGVELQFFLSAVWGLLFLLASVDGVRFYLWAAVLASAIPGIVLWYLKDSGKKTLFWSCFGVLLLLCFLLPVIPEIRRQLEALLAVVFRTGETQNPDVTGAVLFLAMAGSLLVFLIELVFHTHWLLYLLTTLLVLTVPFLGVDPGTPAIFLFFLFQMSFWIINGPGRKKRMLSSPERNREKSGRRASIVMLSGVFLLSFFLVNAGAERLYQAAYQAEGFLQRTIKQVTGADAAPDTGTVSRGNLYPAGTRQLQVRVDQEPTETLYLKGFSGGEYGGGEWQPIDEEEIFLQMEQNTLHWGRYSDWAVGMYDSMYFVMNANMLREEPQNARRLWVEREENAANQWYVPYFSRWNRVATWWQMGAGNGYGYEYYEQNEMTIDWNNIPPGFEMNRDWYYEIQTAYRKEIGDVYTRVPKDQIPRLAELCESTPAESLEEITAFILSTLQENTVYTQMPGLFPINEDPVEYFLFEGGEGYCQHFASAAVLMYRLYGIPARYAAGYAIPPSSFNKQADGSYLAEVTDEAAHAWPEIFLEDYGWVPIEVTPSVSGIIPVYPGMDQVQLEQLLTAGIPSRAEAGQDEERPGRETTEISQESFSAGQSAEIFPDFRSKETVTEITLYLLLLFILLFFLYRSFRREAIAFMDVQGLYAEIVKTVHFAGFLTEYDSSDTDFIHRLPEVVPGLTHQQAEELLAVVQEAAFGNRPLEKSIENDIRIMYEQIVRTVYHGLPVWKKMIFWIAV